MRLRRPRHWSYCSFGNHCVCLGPNRTGHTRQKDVPSCGAWDGQTSYTRASILTMRQRTALRKVVVVPLERIVGEGRDVSDL